MTLFAFGTHKDGHTHAVLCSDAAEIVALTEQDAVFSARMNQIAFPQEMARLTRVVEAKYAREGV